MGIVYKARHVTLDRLVALKMIRSGEFADPVERERFEAEARAVARLSHPNIVQIYEVGEVEGRPFIALEYVPGQSLADALRGPPFVHRVGRRRAADVDQNGITVSWESRREWIGRDARRDSAVRRHAGSRRV